jgi:hypothetical protein
MRSFDDGSRIARVGSPGNFAPPPLEFDWPFGEPTAPHPVRWRPLTGERRMLVDFLDLNLHEAKSRNRVVRAEALAWLFSDGVHAFSVRSVCDHLAIDLGALRSWVLGRRRVQATRPKHAT